MIGTILAKRYRIDERIGGGGMALVYRAHDLQLDRDVAVKVLRGQFGTDEDFIRRFRREAQNAASLSHPNVVQIYDVGRDDEQYFIVMELVEGQTLKALIQSQGPLPIPEATRIAVEILAALAHAHEAKIVHRDIKPHNILIARDGRVKVTDFGIARATTTDTVTHTGSIMGSAHYFSPEQANGQPTGEKSDIYSMGIVLYEMMTGSVPFQGESPITVALKHIRDRVVPPSQLNSEVPAELDDIILQALEKEPEDRWPSADAMRAALEQFALDHAAGRTHIASGDFPTMDLRGMKARRGRRLDDDEELEDEHAPDVRRRERRSGRGAWIWVSVVAVFVVLLIGAGVWGAVALLSVPEVDVPNIVGMPIEQAQSELKKAKLTSSVVGSQFSDQPLNTVIRSNPAGGTKVKQGREVEITLSKGQNQLSVPDVRGKTLDEAKGVLESAQFQVSPDVTRQYSAQYPEGTVIDMAPSAFSLLPVGSTVKLTVSSGPLKVPTVVNLPLTDAKKALQNAGLSLGTVEYVNDPTIAKDIVISSSPVQGTPVPLNQVVNLMVSQGPVTGGTPFEKQIVVAGDATRLYDVKVELIDVVNGVPNTSLIFSDKKPGGTPVTVKGSYFGTATLRVSVDNKEAQRISLP